MNISSNFSPQCLLCRLYSLSVLLAVSLYFCRKLASPSSCLRPTRYSTSQDLKNLTYHSVWPKQKFQQNCKYTAFGNSCGITFLFCFKPSQFEVSQAMHFSYHLSSDGFLLHPLCFFVFPKHISVYQLFCFFSYFYSYSYSSHRGIFLVNISIFKMSPLQVFYVIFSS